MKRTFLTSFVALLCVFACIFGFAACVETDDKKGSGSDVTGGDGSDTAGGDGSDTTDGDGSADEAFKLTFELSADGTYYILTGYEGTFGGDTLTIPGTHENLPVKEIGEAAFKNCTTLKSVSYGSVTDIGDYAFEGTGITSFASAAIKNCGKGVFKNCTSLTSFKLNQALTEISDEMFYGCTKLQMTTYDSSAACVRVGEGAFYGCTALQTYAVPPKTKRVEKTAFKNCTALIELELPKTVEYIGEYAFQNCDNATVKFKLKAGWKAGGESLNSTSDDALTRYLTQTYVDKVWTNALAANA